MLDPLLPCYPPRMALALRPILFLAAAAAAVAFLVAYRGPGRNLLVFGAASLKDALDDADAQYQRDSGSKILVSYGASSALAKEIENGAPADIFWSADPDWMDYLEERRLVKPESRFNRLGNKLVLIAPIYSRINLTISRNFPLAQALANDRLAMADPANVPAGRYGRAALEALGVWSSVINKIEPAEDVRATLALVSRGEAPLGIVYQTDAVADKRVKILGTFPESTHPPIIYPIAIMASSINPGSTPYLNFLKSPRSRPTFEKQGFIVLGE
jgi:molybdate transport system substrate-binding protein